MPAAAGPAPSRFLPPGGKKNVLRAAVREAAACGAPLSVATRSAPLLRVLSPQLSRSGGTEPGEGWRRGGPVSGPGQARRGRGGARPGARVSLGRVRAHLRGGTGGLVRGALEGRVGNATVRTGASMCVGGRGRAWGWDASTTLPVQEPSRRCCRPAFEGLRAATKGDALLNQQPLLAQLWVVRSVCFFPQLVTVNHS